MQGGMNNELWLSHADDVQPQVELQERIWEELRWEVADTAAINVQVEDFVATLSGSVRSYDARLTAQRAAERVGGVRVVANELSVVLPASDRRPDDVLAAAVANALLWDIRVPHTRLAVRIADGWVTLEGSVERQGERAAAEDVVSHLTGIRGISSEIDVVPSDMPPNLRRLAEAALERLELRGSHVSLDTHDRTVALHGRVHSLADRQAVERAVWGVPGVAVVEDLVTVR